MTKATHLGGSGLQYKPIEATDWLTPAKENAREINRIMDTQAANIREVGNQEIAAAAQQDKLIMALGNLIPTFMANAEKKKVKQQNELRNILKLEDITPEVLNTAKEAYKLQKEGLLKEHIELGKLANWDKVTPVLADKLLNGSAAELVVLQETLAAKTLLYNGSY